MIEDSDNMNVKELVDYLGLKKLTQNIDETRPLSGCYICDLLSYVMSHASKGNVWITVQTNINVVAVASLTEVGCVIVPENIDVEEVTIKKAEAEGIIMLSSSMTAYDIAKKLSQVL